MLEEVKVRLEDCGIDVVGAMERMMNNEDLFFRMMKKFPEDTIFPNLKDALERKDYKAGFEFAHALKGVAGNLGLDSIMNADVVIVERLRNYAEPNIVGIEEDLEKLEEAYVKVCAELQRL